MRVRDMPAITVARGLLGDRSKRNLAANTVLMEQANGLVVKYHDTDIVRLSDNGDIHLNTGGWNTRSTIERMNAVMPSGILIRLSKGVTTAYVGNKQEIVFNDTLTIPAWLAL